MLVTIEAFLDIENRLNIFRDPTHSGLVNRRN